MHIEKIIKNPVITQKQLNTNHSVYSENITSYASLDHLDLSFTRKILPSQVSSKYAITEPSAHIKTFTKKTRNVSNKETTACWCGLGDSGKS